MAWGQTHLFILLFSIAAVSCNVNEPNSSPREIFPRAASISAEPTVKTVCGYFDYKAQSDENHLRKRGNSTDRRRRNNVALWKKKGTNSTTKSHKNIRVRSQSETLIWYTMWGCGLQVAPEDAACLYSGQIDPANPKTIAPYPPKTPKNLKLAPGYFDKDKQMCGKKIFYTHRTLIWYIKKGNKKEKKTFDYTVNGFCFNPKYTEPGYDYCKDCNTIAISNFFRFGGDTPPSEWLSDNLF
ncbi:hypothetical protein CROQUDRAFT_134689 [Cronartium quercuum f. sp. fusiforme G11]|uniref:Secreted protein n=1 Tax=Cronartium quercuum f. sp. fusiforme G11 TaxID=708437 RepID=A0A9P6NE03_9BASI|nr:hypothetical protein CROQUDRAFT_134689 [Cronartium quercuum f. sp. fusiforme G11]